MVLTNLYVGRCGDAGMENRLTDAGKGRKERVGCVESAALAYTHCPVQAIGSSRASSPP